MSPTHVGSLSSPLTLRHFAWVFCTFWMFTRFSVISSSCASVRGGGSGRPGSRRTPPPSPHPRGLQALTELLIDEGHLLPNQLQLLPQEFLAEGIVQPRPTARAQSLASWSHNLPTCRSKPPPPPMFPSVQPPISPRLQPSPSCPPTFTLQLSFPDLSSPSPSPLLLTSSLPFPQLPIA